MLQKCLRRLEHERDRLAELIHDIREEIPRETDAHWDVLKHLKRAVKEIALAETDIADYGKFHSFADSRVGDPDQPGVLIRDTQRGSTDR